MFGEIAERREWIDLGKRFDVWRYGHGDTARTLLKLLHSRVPTDGDMSRMDGPMPLDVSPPAHNAADET